MLLYDLPCPRTNAQKWPWNPPPFRPQNLSPYHFRSLFLLPILPSSRHVQIFKRKSILLPYVRASLGSHCWQVQSLAKHEWPLSTFSVFPLSFPTVIQLLGRSSSGDPSGETFFFLRRLSSVSMFVFPPKPWAPGRQEAGLVHLCHCPGVWRRVKC